MCVNVYFCIHLCILTGFKCTDLISITGYAVYKSLHVIAVLIDAYIDTFVQYKEGQWKIPLL